MERQCEDSEESEDEDEDEDGIAPTPHQMERQHGVTSSVFTMRSTHSRLYGCLISVSIAISLFIFIFSSQSKSARHVTDSFPHSNRLISESITRVSPGEAQ